MKKFATREGTQLYSKKHVPLEYQELGQTGLFVSQAGFGCYRVDSSVDEHRLALKKALRSGVNLIDTSSNYSDGGSEELVGAVVRELDQAGEVPRESVVIVSKAGYLQGQNYELSRERKQSGKPFPELVLYADGLEHCIHPEFLEDQLTRSLARLQAETVDVYLLHNPEYYLSWAYHHGLALSEARAEYDRRIESAFRHLETEVKRGRIQFYGISSNTFPKPSSDVEFTSLETVWNIAEQISSEHHFRVIQLPMNLFETGGVTQKNQSYTRSVLEFAQSKRLGVLINRPLNAIVGGSLVRLADTCEGTRLPISREIKMQVASIDSDWQAETLSRAAVRALRSTKGITTVLVGMRQEPYVDDIVTELAGSVTIKEREKSWLSLTQAFQFR